MVDTFEKFDVSTKCPRSTNEGGVFVGVCRCQKMFWLLYNVRKIKGKMIDGENK